MPPKTRFVIRVPGRADVGFDTAEQVLDALNDLKNAKGVTVADLQAALDRIGYRLRPLDIVLLHTGADKRLDSPDYFAQPGLGRDGVLWLVGQG